MASDAAAMGFHMYEQELEVWAEEGGSSICKSAEQKAAQATHYLRSIYKRKVHADGIRRIRNRIMQQERCMTVANEQGKTKQKI
jgi:hypothetical protein